MSGTASPDRLDADTAMIPQERRAAQVSLGDQYGCTVMDNARIKCWGYNDDGQLGTGDTQFYGPSLASLGDLLPQVDLGTGRSALQVSAGRRHSCAVLDDGSVKCWGRNAAGSCGIGSTSAIDTPGELGDGLPAVPLGTGRVARQVEVGDDMSCARLDDGSVKCWGKNNRGQAGQGGGGTLGDVPGELGDALPPVDLGTDRSATRIAVGGSHACALLDDGTVKCWGRNEGGVLGLGHLRAIGDDPDEMGDLLLPVDLGTDRAAVDIEAGDNHTCAVLDNGSVKCWGDNSEGQLGQGDTLDRGDDGGELGDVLPPILLPTGRTAVEVTVGEAHTCARLDDQTVRCWGQNGFGKHGAGDQIDRGALPGEMGDALVEVLVGPGLQIIGLDAGYTTTCAHLSDLTLKCWGLNTAGQLGIGDIRARGLRPEDMGPRLRRVILSGDPFDLPDTGAPSADTGAPHTGQDPPVDSDTDLPPPVDSDTDLPPPVDSDTDLPPPVDSDTDLLPPVDSDVELPPETGMGGGPGGGPGGGDTDVGGPGGPGGDTDVGGPGGPGGGPGGPGSGDTDVGGPGGPGGGDTDVGGPAVGDTGVGGPGGPGGGPGGDDTDVGGPGGPGSPETGLPPEPDSGGAVGGESLPDPPLDSATETGLDDLTGSEDETSLQDTDADPPESPAESLAPEPESAPPPIDTDVPDPVDTDDDSPADSLAIDSEAVDTADSGPPLVIDSSPAAESDSPAVAESDPQEDSDTPEVIHSAPPEDSDTVVVIDSDTPADTDEGVPVGGGADSKGECGCAVGPSAGSGWLIGLLVMWRRRRRVARAPPAAARAGVSQSRPH